MIIKKYQAKTEAEAVEQAKKELGQNVVIMNVRDAKKKGFFRFFKPKQVEITVALEEEAERMPAKKEDTALKSGGILPKELVQSTMDVTQKPAEKKGVKGLAERIKKVLMFFYSGLVGVRCGVRYLLRPLRRREIIAGNLGSIYSKMYEIADIGQPEKWPFEDTYVYIPENSDAVLKQLFGDYMTMPEPDKRKHHFKSVTFLKEKDD